MVSGRSGGLTQALTMRWASPQLDSTIGLYYRNFADKLGQTHLTNFAGPLPRNPNGKIDRKLLATGWVERHAG